MLKQFSVFFFFSFFLLVGYSSAADSTLIKNSVLSKNTMLPIPSLSQRTQARVLDLTNISYGVTLQKTSIGGFVSIYHEYADRYFLHTHAGMSLEFNKTAKTTYAGINTFVVRNISLFGFGKLYKLGKLGVGIRNGMYFNRSDMAIYARPILGITQPYLQIFYEPAIYLYNEFDDTLISRHSITIAVTFWVSDGSNGIDAKAANFVNF